MGWEANILKFIESVNWIFAKTYAKTAPHEYVVKEHKPELIEEFHSFVDYIRQHGYKQKFWNKEYIYFKVGVYKYWTMGAPIKETTIINREKIK